MDICKKKQKKIKPFSDEELTAGDFWCFTAIKRKSFFFTSFVVGKRTTNTCRLLMNRFEDCIKKPTLDNKLDVLSDGNFEYEITLPEYFPINCMNYGQLIKIKKEGRVVGKRKKVIFGNPEWIETVNVECHNGIMRGRISRLIRKTKCHSKCKFQLEKHIALFQFYWNFGKYLHGKMSPGMEEGLTHKLWTWGNFLHWKLRIVN